MDSAGLDTGEEEEFLEQKLMVQESIRSLVYLTMGIDHPLQEVALNTFVFDDDVTPETTEE